MMSQAEVPTPICLIDPNISNNVGGHVPYARAICDEARASTHRVRVLAHQTVSPDLIRDLGAEPVFRYDTWHRFVKVRKLGFLLDPLLRNWAFYRDLRRAFKSGLTGEWVVFMPYVDYRQMLAWAWLLNCLPPAHVPTVVLLFRHPCHDLGANPERSRNIWWVRLGFFALERLASGRRLRLATDTPQLAEEYRRLTKIPIEEFPIPHTVDVERELEPPLRARDRAIRLVSIGDARKEKGFTLIAEAIRRLQARVESKGLEFVLQSNIVDEANGELKKTCQALADLRLKNVRLIDQPLTRHAYNRLLAEADVVLLPYWRWAYCARTSGVFAEALAAGKPVIVTQGTWMSDQLLADHGAGVTFRDGDEEDLVRAILEVRERYSALADQARLRRARWVAYHNPRTFLHLLLNEPSPAEPPRNTSAEDAGARLRT